MILPRKDSDKIYDLFLFNIDKETYKLLPEIMKIKLNGFEDKNYTININYNEIEVFKIFFIKLQKTNERILQDIP